MLLRSKMDKAVGAAEEQGKDRDFSVTSKGSRAGRARSAEETGSWRNNQFSAQGPGSSGWGVDEVRTSDLTTISMLRMLKRCPHFLSPLPAETKPFF